MTANLTPQRERLFLLTLAGINFSHILDFMVMMPLGPILIRELAIGTHEFGLLVASYSFSAAASGLLAATFIDRYERKRMLLVMFALFGIATLACGLAPSYATLFAARGLAGAFGGVLGALVQTMVGDAIPYARRAKASGTVATAFSISTIAGVPLSLWLANLFSWRAPFFFVGVLTVLFMVVGARVLPELRLHVREERPHPLAALGEVLVDPNHRRALLFSALIIFSGFTVIPYITIYTVGNVGIPQSQIPWIYLAGGAATLFTARRIGHYADLHGKVRVYRQTALLATIPLLVITHLSGIPLAGWLVCTTLFFVLVSGRMIPAMTIITSAAQPRLRGTFMSVNGTVQSVSMGLATTLSGFIIQQEGGRIVGYPVVGYVAIAANVLAILYVSRIFIHDAPVAPHQAP